MPGRNFWRISSTQTSTFIDQIMAAQSGGRLLDGSGKGRNISRGLLQPVLKFMQQISASSAIDHLSQLYPGIKRGACNLCPDSVFAFDNSFFDHVICSAVPTSPVVRKTFCKCSLNCAACWKPAKPFIRMASDIGIENNIVDIGDGRFALPTVLTASCWQGHW